MASKNIPLLETASCGPASFEDKPFTANNLEKILPKKKKEPAFMMMRSFSSPSVISTLKEPGKRSHSASYSEQKTELLMCKRPSKSNASLLNKRPLTPSKSIAIPRPRSKSKPPIIHDILESSGHTKPSLYPTESMSPVYGSSPNSNYGKQNYFFQQVAKLTNLKAETNSKDQLTTTLSPEELDTDFLKLLETYEHIDINFEKELLASSPTSAAPASAADKDEMTKEEMRNVEMKENNYFGLFTLSSKKRAQENGKK